MRNEGFNLRLSLPRSDHWLDHGDSYRNLDEDLAQIEIELNLRDRNHGRRRKYPQIGDRGRPISRTVGGPSEQEQHREYVQKGYYST